jgi:hypothetical protein
MNRIYPEAKGFEGCGSKEDEGIGFPANDHRRSLGAVDHEINLRDGHDILGAIRVMDGPRPDWSDADLCDELSRNPSEQRACVHQPLDLDAALRVKRMLEKEFHSERAHNAAILCRPTPGVKVWQPPGMHRLAAWPSPQRSQ